MNKFLSIVCLLIVVSSSAQKNYETRKEAEAAIKENQFKSSLGWTIKTGDEINLGKGSMPDKRFAFVTEMPNLLTYNQYTDYNNSKLPHTYNGRGAKVADLMVAGNKKSGFYIIAKLKVGQLSRYVMDIENAIEAGEVQLPAEYAKKDIPANNNTVPASSSADELKKLKDLFDSGALTKEEYDAAKKKILDKM